MSKVERMRGARPKTAPIKTAPSGKPAGMESSQRLAKVIARAGLCSRREAEAWITNGRVNVNGTVCSTPAVNVGLCDAVLVDGIPLPSPDRTRLFLFHKPRGLVTSDHDPEGRKTIMDFLRETWPEGPRVVTIGRLDINTEGLLLLTNDGGLARILELPETGWVRRYRVRAKGTIDQAKLDTLAGGFSIEGVDYAGIEATLDRVQGANCWLTMGLREGKNREIKRVLSHLGLEVNRLIRLSFGPFQLLELAEGGIEEIPTRVLRGQLGEALAAKAGVRFEVANANPQDKTPRRTRVERGQTPNDMPPRSERRPSNRKKLDLAEEMHPRQDRPAPGKRKHISTIRAERSGPQDEAKPRARIERFQTADRHDRVIQVERVVPNESRDEPRRRAGEPSGRSADRPKRHSRTKLSPSAAGKRERVARSGGHRAEMQKDGATRKQTSGPRADHVEAGSRKPSTNSNAPRFKTRSDPERGRKKPPAAGRRSNSPARPAKRPSDRGARRPRPKN